MGIEDRLNYCIYKSLCLLFGTSDIFLRIHGSLQIFQRKVECRICCDQFQQIIIFAFYLDSLSGLPWKAHGYAHEVPDGLHLLLQHPS